MKAPAQNQNHATNLFIRKYASSIMGLLLEFDRLRFQGTDEHGSPITLLFVGSCGDMISGALVKRTAESGYALLGIK